MKRKIFAALCIIVLAVSACSKSSVPAPDNNNSGNTGGTENTGGTGATATTDTIIYTYQAGGINLDKDMKLTDINLAFIGNTSYIARSYVTSGIFVTTRWVNVKGGTIEKIDNRTYVFHFPNTVTGLATKADRADKIYQETTLTTTDGKKKILINFIQNYMDLGADADIPGEMTVDRFITISTVTTNNSIRLISPKF